MQGTQREARVPPDFEALAAEMTGPTASDQGSSATAATCCALGQASSALSLSDRG